MTRIVLYLLLVVATATPPLFALTWILHRLHHQHGQNLLVLASLAEGLIAAGELLAFWIMVRLADKRPWATAGYTQQGLALGLLGGFAIGAAMLSASILVFLLLGVYYVTALVSSVLVLVPLGLYFFVALSEETLFRGYMFQTLEGHWGSGVR